MLDLESLEAMLRSNGSHEVAGLALQVGHLNLYVAQFVAKRILLEDVPAKESLVGENDSSTILLGVHNLLLYQRKPLGLPD